METLMKKLPETMKTYNMSSTDALKCLISQEKDLKNPKNLRKCYSCENLGIFNLFNERYECRFHTNSFNYCNFPKCDNFREKNNNMCDLHSTKCGECKVTIPSRNEPKKYDRIIYYSKKDKCDQCVINEKDNYIKTFICIECNGKKIIWNNKRRFKCNECNSKFVYIYEKIDINKSWIENTSIPYFQDKSDGKTHCIIYRAIGNDHSGYCSGEEADEDFPTINELRFKFDDIKNEDLDISNLNYKQKGCSSYPNFGSGYCKGFGLMFEAIKIIKVSNINILYDDTDLEKV